MKKRIPSEDEVWVRKRFSFARHGEEEKWLEEMAGKGLQLDWVSLSGYGFKKVQPVSMQYMVDFLSKKDSADADTIDAYNQLHEGWLHVCAAWGRDYFRCEGDQYPQRHHYNIEQFIKDEKWIALLRTCGYIGAPLLVFLIPVMLKVSCGWDTHSILAFASFGSAIGFAVGWLLRYWETIGSFVLRVNYLCGLKKML